jgi:gamma-glutamyltranspeptidase / glutathione hydrolase
MKGVVSAGHPKTVEAGVFALREGGNAIDAAIAAQLMAGVSEPLLTGLGGGGLATLRLDGNVTVVDLFADMPGHSLSEGTIPPMDVVEVDFGPDTQTFRYGPGSVTVPSMISALWRLHEMGASLPMSRLAMPAIATAADGLEISRGLSRSIELLWPIVDADKGMRALFGKDGGPAPSGTRYRMEALSNTLRRFATEGPDFLLEGDGARAMFDTLKGRSRLTPQDLRAYEVDWIEPLVGQYRDARVYVPPPPSLAGVAVLRTLDELSRRIPAPEPLTPEHILWLAAAMDRVERASDETFRNRLFEEGFLDGWMSDSGSGYTTHISVVDDSGNSVAITSSLGETAGIMVPETGIILNNFLGEEDVNPAGHSRAIGERLYTMCCPTLIERGEDIITMGTGGSSRIRSAILHGVVFLCDEDFTLRETVEADRMHLQGGVLRVEDRTRKPGWQEIIRRKYPNLAVFADPTIYFGGLHAAGRIGGQLTGAGDQRRSGTSECV